MLKKVLFSLEITVLLFNFFVMSHVFAEVREYNGMGEYIMGDFETFDIAKQRAKARAEKNAEEQAGVYVGSYTRTINAKVTDDEITVITNEIVRVKKIDYKTNPTTDGKGFVVRAYITADINTDDISKWLSKSKKEKDRLVEQNLLLKESIDEQEKKIAELKRELESAKSNEEREKIEEGIYSVNNIFLAQQKMEQATACSLENDYLKAVSLLTEAIELDPSNALAYCNRGNTYSLDLQDYESAIVDYSKAIEFSPKFGRAYSDRGYSYMSLGKFAKAISDFNSAIDIYSKDKMAYIGRSLAYCAMKNFSSALSDCNRVIEIYPKEEVAYYTRGCVYSAMKEYALGIQDLNYAIELGGNAPEMYYVRGYMYKCIGNLAKANEDFDMAKNLGFQMPS